MPLSILDMEVDHQNKRELQRIKETKVCFQQNEVSLNPIKNVLVLFISEVLYRVLKVSDPDPKLFDYLYRSIYFLEHTEEGVANFHLVFLLGLLHYLGIFPHTETFRPNTYFDMLHGTFTEKLPTHKYYLNTLEGSIFASLLRISYENMSLYSFSRQDRALILHRILTYYRLHLPEFPEIKSLAILQSLFD